MSQDKTRRDTQSLYVYVCMYVLSNTRFFLSLQNPLEFMRVNGSKLLQEDTLYFYFFLYSAANMFSLALTLQCQ